MSELSRSTSRKLGRKLSRRLSLVTRVPNLISTRLRSEFGSRDSLAVRRDNRPLEIAVIAPDKTQRILVGQSPETVCGLISMLLAEYCVVCPRLTLAGSHAEVDPCADIALLEGDVLIVQEGFTSRDPRTERDGRYRVTDQFWREEERYVSSLRSAAELYGYPLKRAGCLSIHQHELVFGPLATLASSCAILLHQMKEALLTWDSGRTTVGQLFSAQWWGQCEEYQEMYRRTRQFLRDKTMVDEDFPELCKLRRGAALHSLPALLHLPVSPANI